MQLSLVKGGVISLRAFTVRLSDEDDEILQNLCEKTGLLPVDVIRQLIHGAGKNPDLIQGNPRIQTKKNFLEPLGFSAHRDNGVIFFRGEFSGTDCLALTFQRALSQGESLSVRFPGKKIERFREVCEKYGLPGFLFFKILFRAENDWKYCVFHLEQLDEESCFSFSDRTGNYHLLLARIAQSQFSDFLTLEVKL